MTVTRPADPLEGGPSSSTSLSSKHTGRGSGLTNDDSLLLPHSLSELESLENASNSPLSSDPLASLAASKSAPSKPELSASWVTALARVASAPSQNAQARSKADGAGKEHAAPPPLRLSLPVGPRGTVADMSKRKLYGLCFVQLPLYNNKEHTGTRVVSWAHSWLRFDGSG